MAEAQVQSNIRGYKGYQGNPLVKREGSVEWTPELVEEFLRCSTDPIYFCEKYMKVIHVDRGLIPLKLYDYQKEIIETIRDNRDSIFTCARQAGKTTSFVGFICWYIIFHSEKDVAILANKAATAREILGRIRLAYMNLPKWLQQNVVEWNKGSVILENNSRVIADSTTSDTVRGYSFSLVVIDEAAHIDKWDEFFTSVYPTISSGKTTKLVLVSTPNGLNHFYSTWANALKGRNGYAHLLVKWDQVPGRDEVWKTKTLQSMNFDVEKFDQEYNCEFQGSSGTLIAGWKLKELVADIPYNSKDGLIQYNRPGKDRIYILVADVSHGKGLDYSCFSIFDISSMPYNQVCVYRSNTISPLDFAEFIHLTAKTYNNAYVLVELNDLGQQVSDAIFLDMEYEAILSTGNAPGLNKRISDGGFGRTPDRGIRTTKAVKSIGCSVLKLLVEQNQLIINNADTIYELSRFSKKGKSYEAENGVHDDTVVTLFLFAWLTAQEFFKELSDINTLQRLRDMSDAEIEAEMLPLGLYTNHGVETPVEEMIKTTKEWFTWD